LTAAHIIELQQFQKVNASTMHQEMWTLVMQKNQSDENILF
jgi:hypothetical protein